MPRRSCAIFSAITGSEPQGQGVPGRGRLNFPADESGIIWAALFGIVFFRESIPITSVVGALMITGAAVYSFLHKRKNSKT